MIRLSKTDNDLIHTQRTVNLNSPEKAYMGGEFLTNSKDHIQLLIYDENEDILLAWWPRPNSAILFNSKEQT